VQKNEKWGFIDNNGELCIDLKYDSVGFFSEGKAAIKINNYKEGGDWWAYIDRNDQIIIDFYLYDAAEGRMILVGEFNEGLAFVSKTFYSIIDDKGNNVYLGSSSEFFIMAGTYYSQYDIIPGYIFTDEAMKQRKYGFVGLDGNIRIEPIFDYVYGPCGEYIRVENIVDGEYKIGLIKLIQ
jgi:hypothetical protein